MLFGLRARTSTTTIRSSSSPFAINFDSRRQKAAGEDIRRPPAATYSLLLPWFVAALRMGLRVRVVFIVIDRPADVVLPLVDLLMFLRRQPAAIRRTVVRRLTVDA